MLIIQDTRNMFQRISGMPISSTNAKSALRQAGINTGSKQYQAVIASMEKALCGGIGYTNIQCIKNQMSMYDKDGDYIDPTTGLAGLLVTDENRATRHNIIDIPESSKKEMFESTKREFLRENGISNGDTTKRSDVFTNLHRKMSKNDRLAAGHTLGQYERQYRQAFYDAAKAADPNWDLGLPIPPGALDHVTRESIESTLVESGTKLVKKTFDVKA